jgi:AcrR family transcriptional regulator/predicted DNA-binding transcriptional regulator AlpA
MDRLNDGPLRMSDLEKLTGLSRRTIHYYLSEGLLTQPLRTGKTMAYYNREHVKELHLIKELREKGYPIAIIKKMIDKGSAQEKEGSRNEYQDFHKRKQQLMEKAVEIFSKIGYHKAKISDITRAVGLGPSSFYLYFPSKKALFIECMDQVFQSMFSDVVDKIEGEKHPLRRLRLRAEIVIKSHQQFIDILQVLRTTFEDDPRLEAKRREIYALIREPVKKNLQWAVREGLFPPLNLEIVSYILIGLLEAAQLLFSLEDRFTVDEFLDTVDKLIYYR